MSANPPNVTWAINDGAAGNERQVLALARALGVVARVVPLRTAAPWRWLAPRVLAGARHALFDGRAAISPPWPDLAIGCGRQAALLTRALGDWTGGRCRTLQILDPRIDARHFDVVVAPYHDHVRGDNVIETIGSLNPVDDAWLAEARTRFAMMAAFPSPRTAVLIGASHRAQALDEAYFDALLACLATRFARDGGSFLVTTSRRTPAVLGNRLRSAFARWPGCFWSNDHDGENPYAGMLGWADRVVVTPDSVNMLSEACATGAPVHTLLTRPLRGKLAEFHAALTRGGHLFDIDGTSATPAPALRETASVARDVRTRLGF